MFDRYTFTFGMVGNPSVSFTVTANEEEVGTATAIIQDKGGDPTKTLRGLVMKHARARFGYVPMFPMEG